jgi:hypothetical protein
MIQLYGKLNIKITLESCLHIPYALVGDSEVVEFLKKNSLKLDSNSLYTCTTGTFFNTHDKIYTTETCFIDSLFPKGLGDILSKYPEIVFSGPIKLFIGDKEFKSSLGIFQRKSIIAVYDAVDKQLSYLFRKALMPWKVEGE